MTARTIRYTSESPFEFESDTTLMKQIELFFRFNNVTYHVASETNLNLGIEIEELRTVIDRTVEVEFHCKSDQAIKDSWVHIKGYFIDHCGDIQEDVTISKKEVVVRIEKLLDVIKLYKNKYDITAAILFDSPIQIFVKGQEESIFITRSLFDQLDDKYVLNYIMYAIDLRKKIFNQLQEVIESELNNAKSLNEEIRVLPGVSDKFSDRLILEYIEMLRINGYIENEESLNKLENIMQRLLVSNGKKYTKNKSDYKHRVGDKFKILGKIFANLYD